MPTGTWSRAWKRRYELTSTSLTTVLCAARLALAGLLPRATMRASFAWKRSPSAFDSRGSDLRLRRQQQESDREPGPESHDTILLLPALGAQPRLAAPV